MGYALHRLGNMAYFAGEYSRAIQLNEESLTLYRQVDHKIGMGSDLLVIGQAARRQQDFERAAARLRDSLNMFQEVGSKGGTAET